MTKPPRRLNCREVADLDMRVIIAGPLPKLVTLTYAAASSMRLSAFAAWILTFLSGWPSIASIGARAAACLILPSAATASLAPCRHPAG
jgi:hypothetical protein